MRYFDAHCHLYMEEFDTDREEVLARMRESETGGIVIGVDLETSRASVKLAEENEFLFASVGLHPKDNLEEQFDVEAFTELAKHSRVVAIGECGLDYFTRDGSVADEETKHIQKERFALQIELAANVQKPLILHCRDAHEDVLSMLTEAKAKYGDALAIVVHFCTCSGDIAEQYLALGATLSFPGPVTFTDMYDDSIKMCPLDRFTTETDSPFAAPKTRRGKRNEPVFVDEIVAKIALLKGLEASEVAKASVLNAKRVFGL